MHVLLWIIQLVLAALFATVGVMKLTQPKEKLARNMRWVEDFSTDRIKLIGALEVLAAIGLILPGCTGILSWLTPVAATGLVVLMILAAMTHRRRGEQQMIYLNVVLGVLAALVMILRFGPYAW